MARAFRDWALRRHGSLDAVNAAWGTAFWGQTFGVPEEIHAPLPTPSMQNPSLELDWRRFSSEQILECFRAERDVLRELTAGGRTALISTHHLGTVDRLADSVALLNGRLLAHGPVAETTTPPILSTLLGARLPDGEGRVPADLTGGRSL